MYNPPEIKLEIQDTLGFLNLKYDYESFKDSRGNLTRKFKIEKDSVLEIKSYSNIKFNNINCKNLYQAKRLIIEKYYIP